MKLLVVCNIERDFVEVSFFYSIEVVSCRRAIIDLVPISPRSLGFRINTWRTFRKNFKKK